MSKFVMGSKATVTAKISADKKIAIAKKIAAAKEEITMKNNARANKIKEILNNKKYPAVTISRKAIIDALSNIKGVGKKTIAKLIMNMSISNIVDNIINNNSEAIGNAIGNRCVPGTSIKMADVIIENSTNKIINMLAEMIKEANKTSTFEDLKFERFQVREYLVEDLMPEEMKKLFDARSNAKCIEEEVNILNDIKNYMNTHKWMLTSGTKEPMVSNMAESQLSRALGVKANELTNKMGLIDNSYIVTGLKNYTDADGNSVNRASAYYINAVDLAERVENDFMLKVQTNGIIINGVKYVEELASAGQRKKMHSYIFPAEVVEQNENLFNIGGISTDMINAKGGWSMSKLGQVKALVTTSSVPLTRIIGRTISVDNMLIVDDIEVKIDVKNCVEVDGDYNTIKVDTVNVKFTDGGAFTWDPALKNKMLQVRMYAGGKGTLAWFDVVGYCKAKGYNMTIKDLWGVEHDIMKEGITMIAPKSVIKIAGYFKSMDEYREFVKNADMNEIHVCSVQEYGRKVKPLTRQSLQTLIGLSNEDLATMNKNGLSDLKFMKTFAGAWDELSHNKAVGPMVEAYPQFAVSTLGQAIVRESYESKFMNYAFGRIDADAAFRMSTYDFTAAADVWFGGKDKNDPEIGVLKAGEVFNRYENRCKIEELGLFRYPVNGFKGMVVKVSHDNEARKWLNSDALYFNAHDVVVTAMDGDHDGDHFLCSRNKAVINTINKYRKCVDIIVYSFDSDIRKEAEKIYIPSNKVLYNELEAKTRLFARRHNDIGENSNYVRNEFSLIQPGIDAEEFMMHVKRIAIESAAGQASVDSTKTNIPSKKLDSKFTKDIKFKPFTERFKGAVEGHPVWDEEYWSNVTLPANKSIGDRNAMMFVNECGMKYTCDMGEAVYDYTMFTMEDSNELARKTCGKVKMDSKLYRTLRAFCRYISCEAGWAPEEDDQSFEAKLKLMLLSDLRDQERQAYKARDMKKVEELKKLQAEGTMEQCMKNARVSVIELFDLLAMAQGAFFRNYRADHDVEDDIDGLTKLEDIRLKAMRQILIDNVRVAGDYDCSTWNDSDKAHFIADKLWKHANRKPRVEETEEQLSHSRKGSNYRQMMVASLFNEELADFAMLRQPETESEDTMM